MTADYAAVWRTLRLSALVLFGALVLAVLTGGSAIAAGEFWDDDGNPHEGMIEAISKAGITNGCGPGRYCPSASLTRGQAAALLVRAFALESAPGVDPFDDDNDSLFEGPINSLYAAGITNGCGERLFCPTQPITRAQLAAMLAQALGLPSDTQDSRFWDDNDSPHEAAIEALAAAGITSGCGGGAFCPEAPVTRAEAATLIGRALGLSPIELTEDHSQAGEERPPRAATVGIDTSNAVSIRPGQDAADLVAGKPAGTVFLFLPGTHFVDEIIPKDDQKFVGAEGAILTGRDQAQFAFHGGASRVVIDNLVIEHFANPPQLGAIIILPQGRNWIVQNSELRFNAGGGVSAGPGAKILNNYIHHNRQIGVTGQGEDIVIEGNEIAFNNPDLAYDMAWEAGGSKFVDTVGLVVRNNFVHDNRGAGLWTDINNIDTLYEGNLVVDNYGPGIFHEISYSAVIRYNTVRRNAFDFYDGGILIANSSDVEVFGNVVEDNYGGITAVNGPRGSGKYGPYVVENLRVHDNLVRFSAGWMGMWSDGGPNGGLWAFEPAAGNRFYSNDLNATHEAPYMWLNERVSYQEFVAAGQG